MTNNQHPADPTDDGPTSAGQRPINRRRMFIAGAGVAGAAALTKVGTAEAADGTPAITGELNSGDDGATIFRNTNADVTAPGTPGQEGVVGDITDAGNGSHAVLGKTAGVGHAIAGVIARIDNARAATWGRHLGLGAAVEGENKTPDAPIAGPANAVKGIITEAGNGSHAVLGITPGDGHAVAGVNSKLDNGRAATWGRHLGLGAGVEGENQTPAADLAGAANGVLGVVTEVGNGSHAILGKTMGAGHSVAGDTPADAENGQGGPNTTAATWGRHQGVGAGIGGISIAGYGGEFKGGAASVRLIPSDAAPAAPPTDATRKVGELVVDAAGNLWYNTADGGNFTRLNDQGGITMFTNPQRAYDSREEFSPPANANKGRHGSNETRSIDLAEFTDLPAGATGAIVNVTVADTAANGFATVFNGDTADGDAPNASTINYVEAGSYIANGVIVPVGVDGTVKVFTLTPTDVIIDVVGSVGGLRQTTTA